MAMRLEIEIDREENGRWIADVVALPGVMVYGATEAEAIDKARVLALRVLADRLEHGEMDVDLHSIEFAVPALG